MVVVRQDLIYNHRQGPKRRLLLLNLFFVLREHTSRTFYNPHCAAKAQNAASSSLMCVFLLVGGGGGGCGVLMWRDARPAGRYLHGACCHGCTTAGLGCCSKAGQ